MTVYKWKSGSRVGFSAQAAGEQCATLAAKGELTPTALVELNRDKDAPLHNYFEWNDAEAAERYREVQARYIIRSVEVDVVGCGEPVRAFVAVRVSNTSTMEYHEVETVMSNSTLRDALMKQAIADMDAFKRKYESLKELTAVFDAMNAMVV